jgi:S-adenosylmethionine hydrolase
MRSMTSTERPIITFLTDFGLDGAVATCKGVMLGICRDAQIIDVAHSIRKYAIRDGAFLMRFALPYVPVGVHVAVVDPGVGTARRPVAVLADRGDVLIGPDNGLLLPAADALGGVRDARALTNRALWLPATSSTFHGRDIFAPVAAHLAAGDAAFTDVGEAIEPGDLVRLPEPAASVSEGALDTVVTYVDSFGNLRLAGGRDELGTAFGAMDDGTPLIVEFGALMDATPVREATRYGSTFGSVPPGASLVYVDSLGNLAMADNQGSLATRLGVGHDRPLRITRA